MRKLKKSEINFNFRILLFFNNRFKLKKGGVFMPASEIRKDARQALTGKWGMAVCITIIYFVIAFLMGLIQSLFNEQSAIYLMIELVYLVISMPLSFGLVISFMKLKRNEKVSYLDFFKDGFARFNRSWGIWFYTFVKLLLPMVCLILIIILMGFLIGSSIINGSANLNVLLLIASITLYIASIVYIVSRALLYALAYNIAYDNPNLSSKACVLKSEALMKGNRGNLFLLELSFIGWVVLAAFTLGIGFLWLFPYMQVALVCFYDKIAKPEKTDKVEE